MGAAVAMLLPPLAARAQFYDLDGAYRCIAAAKDACTENEAAAPAPKQTKAVPPSMNEAIARVKERRPTPADIALIEARAKAQDPRAVEVLAWCKLNGIGMPPDAVAAFFLYGDAARLGVPRASDNQRAIFETRLTSDERQRVLVKGDAR
jgi:TPR repeat protein